MTIPRVDKDFTSQVRRVARRLIRRAKRKGYGEVDYVIYGAARVRGRARFATGVVTIPTWILLTFNMSNREGFLTYYVAHELAHLFARKYNGHKGHGPAFMEWLKKLCPKDYWHYELDYKPRHAFAAGIRKPANLNTKPAPGEEEPNQT